MSLPHARFTRTIPALVFPRDAQAPIDATHARAGLLPPLAGEGRDGGRRRSRRNTTSPSRLPAVAGLLVLIALLALPLTHAQDTVAVDLQREAVATFAGGCFWCMEPPYDKLDGVLSTTSGYMGGTVDDPTYEQVSTGRTGHAEVVQVRYDPSKVDYATLLEVFWRNIDPVAVNRQFCDAGSQYRSAIFAHDAEQAALARASKQALERSGRFDRPIATEVLAATTFYPAEDYHQDYYQRNPVRYRYYRWSCGRNQRLEELWGDADHQLRRAPRAGSTQPPLGGLRSKLPSRTVGRHSSRNPTAAPLPGRCTLSPHARPGTSPMEDLEPCPRCASTSSSRTRLRRARAAPWRASGSRT